MPDSRQAKGSARPRTSTFGCEGRAGTAGGAAHALARAAAVRARYPCSGFVLKFSSGALNERRLAARDQIGRVSAVVPARNVAAHRVGHHQGAGHSQSLDPNIRSSQS